MCSLSPRSIPRLYRGTLSSRYPAVKVILLVEMKEKGSNQELFQYYDDRAPEYEDAYRGKFFNKVPDLTIYERDTLNIQKAIPDYVKGKCIDIACGTGFWLPFYAKKCSEITLIDQSKTVLVECFKKIQKLGIENKTQTIRNDIFSYSYREHYYDTAVSGFIISHLQENELNNLMDILKTTLKPSGKLLVIDNIWDHARAQLRKSKAGVIKRYLKDGREFKIYKRYFNKADLQSIARKYGYKLEIVYWGKVFFLASGVFL